MLSLYLPSGSVSFLHSHCSHLCVLLLHFTPPYSILPLPHLYHLAIVHHLYLAAYGPVLYLNKFFSLHAKHHFLISPHYNALSIGEKMVMCFSGIPGMVPLCIAYIVHSCCDISIHVGHTPSCRPAQKFRYKMAKGKPKDKPVLTGLWKWSRHPPYFGEIMCWWGIWILCLSPTTNGSLSSHSKSAQYGAIVSPLFTLILLMFGSGVPTAEKPQAKKVFPYELREKRETRTCSCMVKL